MPAEQSTNAATQDVKHARAGAEPVQVSVVIPNFNTSRFIAAAIRSVLGQTYRSLEIIVVDDGSTDDSLEQVARFDDPRLTCLTQPNRGLAAARNAGIAVARGRYVAFLDSDDVWFSEKLARHVAVMDADPTIGLTFSHSAYLDEDGRLTGDYLVSGIARPDALAMVSRNHVGNGSTPVLRRECFERAGTFDEALSGCADWEFWVRVAARSGLSLRLIPDVLTGYRVRPDSMTVSRTGYEAFLEDGLRAIARFPRSLPDLPRPRQAGARAQLYRIASRKALSNGDLPVSRRLLWRAFRHSPSAVLRDLRALAMIGFHAVSLPMPQRMRLRLYRGSRLALQRLVWRHRRDLADPRQAGGAVGDRALTPTLGVTIVIAAYNVGAFIVEAVQSIVAQTSVDWRLIVVNDGSTDATAALARGVADPRVVVIDQENAGVSAARNAGVLLATTPLVAFLDGDDLWDPELLARLTAYLHAHPEVDLVHAGARRITADGRDTGRAVTPVAGVTTARALLRQNDVLVSAVVARREALLQAGLFDPRLAAGEDQDLWIRVAALRPGNIHGFPTVLASYRVRPGQATRNWRRLAGDRALVMSKAVAAIPALSWWDRRVADAHFHRYVGYTAFESADYREAWRQLGAALRRFCPSLLADRSTWFLVAVLTSRLVVPASLHQRLYTRYRRRQAQAAAS